MCTTDFLDSLFCELQMLQSSLGLLKMFSPVLPHLQPCSQKWKHQHRLACYHFYSYTAQPWSNRETCLLINWTLVEAGIILPWSVQYVLALQWHGLVRAVCSACSCGLQHTERTKPGPYCKFSERNFMLSRMFTS